MEHREFDIFSDMLANKDLTIDQLTLVGMTASNTSLQDKDTYKSNEWIRSLFTDSLGNFDENAFNTSYENAKINYNRLALLELSTNLTDEPIYHRDNIFVSPLKTKQGPEFKDVSSDNPYLISSSLVQLGETGLRTKSIDEIALTNKVLLNPTEVKPDFSNAIWGEDPNHNFWKYFNNTLVLALYDEDGTHIDSEGKTVEHHKGDLKLDPNGSFYYEALSGRDIHNRRVLNKMNVLTIDGSWTNRHLDFFDSDDLNLKSVGGSILKNAALVGSMFIPYVGPWVIGASITSQLVGLFGTVGKLATGSSTKIFNEMEGWSKSVSRQASSEYALLHMLCTENMINLVGDVMGQLAEQRFLFKKTPSLFGKTDITTDAGIASKRKELLDIQLKFNNSRIQEILAELGEFNKKALEAVKNLRDESVLKASIDQALNTYTKEYYKIGEVISKGYMTAITTADTYGDAKAAGATDLEATLLTLGHAMGEYAILNTGLGELILPELRTSARRQEAIAKGLTQVARDSFASAESATTKVARHKYAQKMFDLGRDIAKGKYVTGTRTLQSVGAAALGESFEEVSEELLADFSKGCYDVAKWLSGGTTRINTFGYNFLTGEYDTTEVLTRYGMNALGGFMGGGLANANTDFSSMKALNNMAPESLIQLLIYMDRNGEMKDFLKNVDKMNLGNKYLSTKFEVNDKGVKVYAAGTETDNLDLFIKNAIKKLAQLLHEILHANGADISDNEFISKNTFEELRFNALLKSVTADNYITDFNKKVSDVVRLTTAINNAKLSMADLNKDGVVTDPEDRKAERAKKSGEISEQSLKNLQDLENELKEALKDLNALTDGSKSYDFIKEALFEMTEELSGLLDTITFVLFAETKYGQKYDKIPDKLKDSIREEYLQWRSKDAKERIRYLAAVFGAMSELSSSVIKNHGIEYENLANEVIKVNNMIRDFNVIGYDENNQTDLFLAKAANLASWEAMYKHFEGYLVGKFGNEQEKLEYIDLENQELVGTKEEQEQQVNDIIELLRAIGLQVLTKNVSEFIQPFIERGYIGKETKTRLDQFLSKLHNLLTILKEVESRGKTKTELDEISNKYIPILDSIMQYKNQIKALDNTPFEKNYNEFSVSVGTESVNITELLLKLNTILNETEDVSSFNINDDLIKSLNNAILTLKMYRAAIMAARIDTTSATNIYGYNATLNEVAKKVTGKHPELAEINSATADKLVTDIDANLSKLMSMQRLLNLNNGLKLTKQDRVTANAHKLIYKLLRAIVSIKDDDELRNWKGFSTFKETIESLGTLLKLVDGELSTTLNEENKKAIQEEIIKMENAIFDFFKENFGDFTSITEKDISKLTQFISPSRFNLYTNASELLNENLESIDGNSMIWYIAARVQIRASDFYKEYAEAIDPTAERPIAPISPQELAVYNDYANIINGNVASVFAKAFRKSIIDDFNAKSPDLKKKILLDLGENEADIDHFIGKDIEPLLINNLPIPKYTNIVLTEGIAGSGKTKGTLRTLINTLKSKHKEVLSNTWVVHSVGKTNAENLVTDIGMELGENTKAMDRIELMKAIDSTWVEYSRDPISGEYVMSESDYNITEENEIISNRPINKGTESPSIIIIDEITHFTAYDLDQIQKFCKERGITCIVAGDYDQSGVTGSHSLKEYPGVHWELGTKRTSFIRSPKFGVSMRTDNSLKSNNLLKFLDYMYNTEGTLLLDFFQDPKEGVFGDKVYSLEDDDPYSNREGILESIINDVKLMIATLKKEGSSKKIGYIYNDAKSPLYQEFSKDEYKDYIDLKPGNKAQGDEAQYYIIDINPFTENPETEEVVDNMSLEEYKKILYTGITRSEQGSIIITPFEFNGFKLESVENSYRISESKNENLIRDYATKRKELLLSLASDGLDTVIIPRNDKEEDTLLHDSPTAAKGLEEGIEADPTPVQIYNPPPKVDDTAPEDKKLEEVQKLLTENPTKIGDHLTIQRIENRSSSIVEGDITEITDTTVVLSDGTEFGVGILLSEFGIPYKEGDVEYNIIKHSGRVIEEAAVPYEEETLITNDDLLPDQVVAEQIDDTNQEEPLLRVEYNVASGEEDIDMLIHTHNTFETGVVFNDKGEITWDEYNEARIDSINGLINFTGSKISFKGLSKKEYLLRLGYIRSLLLNVKDKEELENKLANYFGLKNVYVTFAYKSTARPGEGNKVKGRPYVSNKPNKFEKNTGEHTEFNGSINPENSEWHNKSLVAIIGSDDIRPGTNEPIGDILEMPLAALSSPWTLMMTKNADGSYRFPEIVAAYTTYSSKGLDKHTISGKLLEDFKDSVKYRQLIELFELFDFTDNAIFFIDDPDFTIAKNFTLLGPRFSKNRGYYYDPDSPLQYDWNGQTEKEWKSLSDFASHNNAVVSKGVYTSKTGMLSGLSHRSLKKGHSFVFYSNDLSLETDELMYKLYLAQEAAKEQGKPFDNKVMVLYVMPPMATFEEYITNLSHYMIPKSSTIDLPQHIGLPFTAYKIVRELASNPRFIEAINRRVPGAGDKVQLEVRNLMSLENDPIALKQALFDLVVWEGYGSDPIRLSNIFLGVLFDSCYNKKTIRDGIRYSLNRDMVDEITSILEGKGIQGVRYRLPITKASKTLGDLVLIDLGPNYTIDGKPIRIHGKVDSYIFRAKMGEFVHRWMKEKKYKKKTRELHYGSIDDTTYNSNYSRLSGTKVKRNPHELTIKYIKGKTGKDYTELFERDPDNALTTIVNDINSSTKNIAIINNGNILIFKIPGYRATFLNNNKESITDITSTLDHDGIYKFLLDLEDASGTIHHYTAEINERGELTRSEIIEDPVDVPPVDEPVNNLLILIDDVSEETFDAWKSDLNNLFTLFNHKLIQNLIDNSSSYEDLLDFINNGELYSNHRMITHVINKKLIQLQTSINESTGDALELLLKALNTLLRIREIIDAREEKKNLQDNNSCNININTESK